MSYKITLDIETYGTNPGCIVREVGIVMFNDKEIFNSHQFFLNTSDQAELGLTIDVKTLDWFLPMALISYQTRQIVLGYNQLTLIAILVTLIQSL